MSTEDCANDVIRRAISGDRAALDGLLASYYSPLAAHIATRLPGDLSGVLSAEDVLQETFLDVFRSIDRAKATNGPSFYSWLVSVAEHQMLDLIRAARAAKRGGGWTPVDAQGESIVSMLEQMAVNSRTPSRSAAGHETVAAVRGALEHLPEDYKEAVRLRYIEGLPMAEAAQRIGRTPAAFQMLCHRAVKQLAALLGSAADFFSRGA